MTDPAAPPLPCEAVLRHVVDVHCHPTDAPSFPTDSMHRIGITICPMATRQSDQSLVRDLALSHPRNVIPCFGYHPWFTHLISLQPVSKEIHYRRLFLDSTLPRANHVEAFERLLPLLPDPIPLYNILADLRSNLEAFPKAMLGEVGLDRAFRIAFDYFASPRELTPFTIPFDHQLAILEAQLDLAIELGRNVSFHSVKSQMATVELLTRMKERHGDPWINISIDMHSCGLSAQTWADIERKHPNIFLSLSTIINSRSPNHKTLLAACSPRRILVESDFNDIDKCAERTWDMVRIVAQIKGWHIEDQWVDDLEECEWGAVRKLEENWRAFQRGNHISYQTKNRAARQFPEDWDSDE